MIIDMNVALDHPVYPTDSTSESLISILDRDGVDKAVVSSWKSLSDYQFERGNDETAKVAKEYPERFIGFATINPFKPEETKRVIRDLNLKGIRLTPNYFWYYPGENVISVVKMTTEAKLPLHVSVTPERPTNFRQCAEFAEAFPNATIIVGQIWIPYFWPALTVLAKKYDNILLEVGPTTTKGIEEAIRTLGAERLVFGSGAPVTRPYSVIEHIRGLDISEDEKNLILGRNAARILGIE